ncbi:cobalamin biosynthesis protein CbiX [Cohnella xylanilytica]|uniref:Cobalamin biosynthesis protein CbiX n=1 Tax=Cohnella xylanilytica TaxID=557555 RepID=A0A841TSL5_9BACL|nr:cobalamin biosynthesis protein CbiX [Cohnella xylanilytica]
MEGSGVKPGVLVISHGSQERGWVDRVEETVEGVRAKLGGGVPVECSYLELVEGRLIQDGIERLEAQGVTDLLAIPLFVSAGSTHVDEIGWSLGAYEEPRRPTDLERCRVNARLTYGKPIADDPEIAEVLLDKLKESSVSSEPSKECLLLIGHGSEEPWFREEWKRGLEGLAARMKRVGGYAGAAVALLRPEEVAERVRELRGSHPRGTAIVAVPVFVSEGYFTSSVIPKRLEGTGCRYAEGSLIPHPKVEEWIRRQASEWLESLSV